ncbi:MAG TPA: hypothetical protein VFA05_01900 [Gaiellaceae bacterium]|nr:hypothetical protein [Gaiellaceae bacterium]
MHRPRAIALVLATGLVVAASPVVWYPLAWPAQDDSVAPSAVSWLILVGVSLLPFVLLAVVGAGGAVATFTAAAALVVAAAVVACGDVAGLDPNAPAGVSAAALVVAPIGACLVVGLLVLVDRVVRAPSEREQHDPREHERGAADAPPGDVLREHAAGGDGGEHD